MDPGRGGNAGSEGLWWHLPRDHIWNLGLELIGKGSQNSALGPRNGPKSKPRTVWENALLGGSSHGPRDWVTGLSLDPWRTTMSSPFGGRQLPAPLDGPFFKTGSPEVSIGAGRLSGPGPTPSELPTRTERNKPSSPGVSRLGSWQPPAGSSESQPHALHLSRRPSAALGWSGPPSVRQEGPA